jgi:hypothetical protein
VAAIATADDDLIMAGFAFVENESNDDFCQVSKRGNSQQFGFQHWW